MRSSSLGLFTLAALSIAALAACSSTSSSPSSESDITDHGDGGTDGETGGDAGLTAFTQAEVQDLVNTNCIGCHSGPSAPQGMSLSGDFTVATVGVPANEAPLLRIKAGAKAESYLFHKVSGTHVSVGGSGARMPRGGTPLADTDIERLGKYIDAL